MNDIVAHTLKSWRSTPFIWGVTDCMLSIGNYIAAAGGTDVTGVFRDTYEDEAGALAHMASYGGMAGFAALAGLIAVDQPERGDVVALGGVCGRTDQIDGSHVGALCTGDQIAARLYRGVIEIDIRFVKIIGSWRI